MASFNRVLRRSVSRRHFLQGAGAAVALPWLDAMTPAFARAADVAAAPPRFVAICATLGFHTPFLVPTKVGKDYAPTPYLEELKAHRDQLTVLSGVSHADQSGANGHTSEMTWLTSAKRPGLAGFKNTISIDQKIAEALGPKTRFPSLVLSLGSESLSWTSNGVPIPAQFSPSKLFAQMFVNGNAQEVAAQVQQLKRGRSILDTIAGETKKLERSLGAPDKAKLEEYLAAVRGLENRLAESEGWATKPKPKVDAKAPTDITNRNDAIGRAKLMYELIAMALRTDSTRTVTLRLSGLNSVPVVEGVKNDWHNLSHHGQDETKIDELKKIELAEFHAFAGFLDQLKNAKEGGVNLLDRTAVLFGSNLGNSSSHDWRNLPLVLAGGGFKHAGHIAGDRQNNTPFANLFVSVGRWMGLPLEKFGYSTGTGISGLDLKS